MAAISTIAAVASLAVGAISAYSSMEQGKKSAANQRKSADEQRKAREEQAAQQKAAQMNEKRQQIREERVRKARIMQASENGGTSGSSGEMGALGSMATNLSSNLGINLGAQQSGQTIAGYNQNSANFNTAAQRNQGRAQNADTMFSLSSNIFNASGGFSNFKSDGFTPNAGGANDVSRTYNADIGGFGIE